MKKLFTILFVSFMVTFAYGQTSFTVNGIKYTTTGTNTVQVSEGGTYIGEINIPSTVTYSGVFYLVTSIGKNAFYNFLIAIFTFKFNQFTVIKGFISGVAKEQISVQAAVIVYF